MHVTVRDNSVGFCEHTSSCERGPWWCGCFHYHKCSDVNCPYN